MTITSNHIKAEPSIQAVATYSKKQMVDNYIASLSFAEQEIASSIKSTMGYDLFFDTAMDIEASILIKDFDIAAYASDKSKLELHYTQTANIALVVMKEAQSCRESVESWLSRVRAHIPNSDLNEVELMGAVASYAEYLTLARAAADKHKHHHDIAMAVVCEVIEIILDKFVGFVVDRPSNTNTPTVATNIGAMLCC